MCSQSFDALDAKVVCRQLGFSTTGEILLCLDFGTADSKIIKFQSHIMISRVSCGA